MFNVANLILDLMLSTKRPSMLINCINTEMSQSENDHSVTLILAMLIFVQPNVLSIYCGPK
jgi:hypothetical protein